MTNDPFDQYNKAPDYLLKGQSEEQSLAQVEGRIRSLAQPPRKSRRFLYTGLAAAAILILVVSSVFLFDSDPIETATGYYEAYPNYVTGVVRGQADKRGAAFEAYDAGDYATAVEIFLEAQTINSIDAFYLGVSLEAVGRWEDASNILLRVCGEVSEQYTSACLWYRSLASVATGDTESAVRDLTLLKNSSSNYKEDAAKLLKKIQ